MGRELTRVIKPGALKITTILAILKGSNKQEMYDNFE